ADALTARSAPPIRWNIGPLHPAPARGRSAPPRPLRRVIAAAPPAPGGRPGTGRPTRPAADAGRRPHGPGGKTGGPARTGRERALQTPTRALPRPVRTARGRPRTDARPEPPRRPSAGGGSRRPGSPAPPDPVKAPL